jgi:hypothetical protein
MRNTVADPRNLVKTEAEPVPPPAQSAAAAKPPEATDPQLLLDVKALADRAGGLDKLREYVDELLHIQQ